MSAPTTRDPLVVNTKDGVVWQRRAVTAEGRGLYAVTGSCSCPEFLMATLAELAEHGIAGSADVLPMPVGPQQPPSAEVYDDLDGVSLSLWDEERTHARTRLALASARRGRRDLRAELYGEQAQHRTTLEQRNAHAKELLALRSRVAVLEAERRTTNEALDGLVRELRETRTPLAAGKPKDARACANCGSAPELWCPDCAACQRGCYGGFKDNPCTHPNAGWPKSGPSVARSADKLRALLAGQRESGGGQ